MAKQNSFFDRGKEYIKFLRLHPCIAAQELLNVDLPPPQRLILRDMWFKPYVLVTAGRGCGKTYILSVLCSLYGLLFPGKKILIVSPSFRQCVVGNTLVATDNGMEYVYDLYNKPDSILSSKGMKECSAFFKNLAEPTKKITSSKGFEIEGALDHRVLVVDNSGLLTYKSLKEVVVGDYICLKSAACVFGEDVSLSPYIPEFISYGNTRRISIPTKLDSNLSYFLGSLVGDGCLTQKNYIHFVNTDDDLLEMCQDSFDVYFGGRVKRSVKKDGVCQLTKGSKLGYEFLSRVGVAGKLAHEKIIPSVVLKGSKENQASFISGLFDTDGCIYFNTKVSHKYKLIISFVSERLINELQVVLLNFGIESSKSVNTSGNRNHPLYSLEISSKRSILCFYEEIGFRCKRKQEKLEAVVDYINTLDMSRTHKDIFPNIGSIFSNIVYTIRHADTTIPFEYLHLYRYFDKNSNPKKGITGLTKNYIRKVLDYCNKESIDSKDIRYVKAVIDARFIFDVVKDISDGFNYTYDFTVEEVHDYFSNGFISHNSKMVFDEVEQRYIKAPILREATTKKPTTGADRCYLNFRGVENRPGSIIQAVPLGDGSKIRGLRGHLIVTDEFAQVPEEIFDMVIRPMGATTTNPMEKVRRLERLKDNLEAGFITMEEYEAELSDQAANKIICTSSAYYTFNHMYRRIQAYEQKIEEGDKNYGVHYVSFRDMPEAFLDMNNIENAKATMSRSGFSIEYDAVWESDSDGIFKASLIDGCRNPKMQVRTKPEPGRRYIMGVDPARSSDAFAIVVIEVGNPSCVVYATQAIGKKFPEMAQTIYDLCDKFNISSVMMDAGSGGGGVAIKDLLANEQFFRGRLILDKEDEEYKHVEGRKILRMHLPRSASVAEAVHASVNLLEQDLLNFPYPPYEFDTEKEQIYSDIQTMIKQMLAITQTETRTGQVHFDIPADGSGNRKKDLYSAFVLAAKCLYDEITRREDNNTLVNKGGLIIPVNRSNSVGSGPSITHIMNLSGRK